MADQFHDTDIVSRISSDTVCYVAALDPNWRPPSPELVIEDSDDENDYDPNFRPLLEQSENLRGIFHKLSQGYGYLKYELRRSVAHYYHGRRGRPRDLDFDILATKEILEVDPAIIHSACRSLTTMNNEQRYFFCAYVQRVRTTCAQLELLIEDNNSLLDKLGVLHYPLEETRHIKRREKVVQAHSNIDFLAKELRDELSVLLSSSLIANFST